MVQQARIDHATWIDFPGLRRIGRAMVQAEGDPSLVKAGYRSRDLRYGFLVLFHFEDIGVLGIDFRCKVDVLPQSMCPACPGCAG